jgi:hypothetical protein
MLPLEERIRVLRNQTMWTCYRSKLGPQSAPRTGIVG